MAEFKFNCPQCGQEIEADESARGQVAKCPHCEKGIVIPRNSQKSRLRPPMSRPKVSVDAPAEPRTPPSAQMVQVKCPHCGTDYEVSSKDVNQSVMCEVCGRMFVSRTDNVAIPKRLARPATKQVPAAGLEKKKRAGVLRVVLKVLIAAVGIVLIAGAVTYGGYIAFGDEPRLKRAISNYESKKYAKAFKVLKDLAEKGIAIAQLYLGDCYANGNGVVLDSESAVKWYRAAADQEIAEALHRMFVCFRDGVGIEKNSKNAAKYCRKAAEAGLAEAQYDMAMLYANGDGVEENAKSAFKWFRKGAEQGYPLALYKFGQCYKLGVGVEKDEDEASKWQNRAVDAWRKSAGEGNTESMVQIAKLYQKGDVVELDKEESVKWYRKAAELGNEYAQFMLAICYRDGDGVEVDNEEAAKWMLKAAETGRNKIVQWAMGEFYRDGIGVEKNPAEAAKWFERAAKKGLAEAKYALAMCYLKGEGVSQDEENGEKILEDAVAAGSEDARKELRKIRSEREERKRLIAAENAKKNERIRKIAENEAEITERKERINNILKGRLKDDWLGFDAGKITITDSTVSVKDEPPLRSVAESLSEKDSLDVIDAALAASKKEIERLEERLKDIARVKEVYDVKELESRKEKCAPCDGSGTIQCARCKGTGEIVSKDSRPCPTCSAGSDDDSDSGFSMNDNSRRKGMVRREVDCNVCYGRGRTSHKCGSCKGWGKIKIPGGGARFDTYETCGDCGGRKTISETCSKCSGSGKVTTWGRCTTCQGVGVVSRGKKVTCPVCEGKGRSKCERCGGRGFTYRPKEGGTSHVVIGNDTEQAMSQMIEKRMKEIILPSISFRPPATIADAIEYFKQASYEFDRKDAPKDQRGVNIVLDISDMDDMPIIPKIGAKNISLWDALKLVCRMTKFKFQILEGSVVMMMPEGARTRDYSTPIDNDTEKAIVRMLEKRMKEIVLPSISFRPPATIADAMEYFRRASRDYDRSDVQSDHRGFDFVLDLGRPIDSDTEMPLIPSVSAKNISLWVALKLVCRLTRFKFQIREGSVVRVMPEEMITEENVKQYRRAAEQGNAEAQTNLGLCYALGQGVKVDEEEAVRWFHKAAVQGNAEAQYNLGIGHALGKGVKEDRVEAVKWFRKAAAQGHAEAQRNLGVCYYGGNGVRENKVEAAKWFRRAADLGNAKAQHNLAICYDFGNGVEANKKEAVKWYRKAADQGIAEAQFNLGVCYDNGEGVEIDKKEAIRWFRKAAEQGHVEAENVLKEMQNS